MRQFLSGCLIALAVIIAFPVSMFLLIRQFATNPAIYIAELDRAEVYKSLIIEIDRSDLATADGLNGFYQAFSQNIELEFLLQDTIEHNLKLSLDYIGGRTDQLIVYLPLDQLRNTLSNEKVKELILIGFEANYFKDKPKCNQAQQSKFNQLNGINNVNDLGDLNKLKLPECTPANKTQVLRLVNQKMSEVIDQSLKGSSFIDEALIANGFGTYDSDYIPASALLNQPEAKEALASLGNAHQVLAKISLAAMIGICVAIVLSICAGLIAGHKGPKILTGLGYVLASLGVLVTGLAGIVLISVGSFAIGAAQGLYAGRIPAGISISESEIIATNIARGIFSPIAIIGVVILIVGIVILLTIRQGSRKPTSD